MGKSEQRNKDQKMAQDLKDRGIERTTSACPVCHRIISSAGYRAHFAGAGCQPRRRVDSSRRVRRG